MIIFLYVCVVLLATISGAIAGLGGGVIIKPLFDVIGYHDARTIGVYSCLAVFTMCIVSIIKQLRNGFSFDLKTVIVISLGSLFGGTLGDQLFDFVTASVENHTVKVIQASLLVLTLILVLLYTLNKDRIKKYHIKNALIIFLVGLFLGMISVFLGIGGGPVNVALLMLCFSYEMKEATIYSIATIFFSQLSKILNLLISNTLWTYDLSVVPYICVAAVIGGFIGTLINQKLSSHKIEKVYCFIIIVLIFISFYNIATNL